MEGLLGSSNPPPPEVLGSGAASTACLVAPETLALALFKGYLKQTGMIISPPGKKYPEHPELSPNAQEIERTLEWRMLQASSIKFKILKAEI